MKKLAYLVAFVLVGAAIESAVAGSHQFAHLSARGQGLAVIAVGAAYLAVVTAVVSAERRRARAARSRAASTVRTW